jgi:hypothetical protein
VLYGFVFSSNFRQLLLPPGSLLQVGRRLARNHRELILVIRAIPLPGLMKSLSSTPAGWFWLQMSALGCTAISCASKGISPASERWGKKHLWPDAAYLRPDEPATGKIRSKNGQAKRLITR